MAPLTSLPGVAEPAARERRAERGTARRRVGASARLASWAGGRSQKGRLFWKCDMASLPEAYCGEF